MKKQAKTKTIKKDIIDLTVEKLDLIEIDVRKTLEVFMDTILKTLEEENIVEIRGFGVFKIQQWKERKGIAGKNRKPVIIKPFKKVKFIMSKNLKNKLNKNEKEK